MGILKNFNVSNKQLLAIGVILSLLGTFLRSADFGMDYLNLFFGYFIGAPVVLLYFPCLIGSFSLLQDMFMDIIS
ncbi:hypothetical protein [Methanobrevibacter sp.]